MTEPTTISTHKDARAHTENLASRLMRDTRGEVLFSAGARARYATDASIYQINPIGVLIPRTPDDVITAVDLCRELAIPVLARLRIRRYVTCAPYS